MSKQVEFFFDVGSPATWLAYTQLPGIAAKAGAEVVWRPFLLGGVFKATGNSSPATVPAKLLYLNRDLARHARRYGVVLNLNPHFPINTLQLMRGATALLGTAEFQPYLRAVFEAIWVRALDMNNPAVVAQVLAEAGIDAAALMERANAPAVKDLLKANTEEAVARGAFGAPTFFVGGEMFFGQDRLDFVREALAG